MNFLDLLSAKKTFEKGGNVMQFLKTSPESTNDLSEIIELAYDLQAGSYIKDFYKNEDKKRKYGAEAASYLEKYLTPDSSLLNVGAGELWTISLICSSLNFQPKRVFNLEISWSRIYKGISFWNKLHANTIPMTPFVADMLQIPLPSKSIDVITSSHGLEPNGAQLTEILTELFRVARTKCVLFEPSYEHCTEEGKQRMDKHGYIKNVRGAVNNLGGKIVDIQLLDSSANPLNPTACFVIEPPIVEDSVSSEDVGFSVPGTDINLEKNDEFYVSSDVGVVFPVLKGIPILKSRSAILATAINS